LCNSHRDLRKRRRPGARHLIASFALATAAYADTLWSTFSKLDRVSRLAPSEIASDLGAPAIPKRREYSRPTLCAAPSRRSEAPA
jgi:hypothetical protein